MLSIGWDDDREALARTGALRALSRALRHRDDVRFERTPSPTRAVRLIARPASLIRPAVWLDGDTPDQPAGEAWRSAAALGASLVAIEGVDGGIVWEACRAPLPPRASERPALIPYADLERGSRASWSGDVHAIGAPRATIERGVRCWPIDPATTAALLGHASEVVALRPGPLVFDAWRVGVPARTFEGRPLLPESSARVLARTVSPLLLATPGFWDDLVAAGPRAGLEPTLTAAAVRAARHALHTRSWRARARQAIDAWRDAPWPKLIEAQQWLRRTAGARMVRGGAKT